MPDIAPEVLREIYRKMVLTRAFDEKLNELVKEGQPILQHSGIGQEATPIAACAALRPDDYLLPYHRGWAWAIGKGMEPRRVLAELIGKKTGYMGGRGGVHLADWKLRVMGRSGIQAAHIPMAAGIGLSIKMRKGDQLVLALFGDGPPNIGEWHEGVNLAAIWRAPVVFVCENNGYAESTRREQTMLNKHIAERAAAYCIPGVTIDGNDIFAIYEAVSAAAASARRGQGPALIEAITYRWLGHFFPNTEHYGGYRPKAEVDAWKAKDPIVRARERLRELGILDDAAARRMDAEVRKQVEEAVQFALESPYPTRQELLAGVWPN